MPTATLYGQVTGWVCVGLLVLLLCRAIIGGTLKVYPLFYGYTGQVLITTVIGLSISWPNQGAYRAYYWAVETSFLLMSVGVTWEIHRKILAHFPGVRRLALMLLSIIF